MLKHDPVLPPEFIYPIDDWRWVERRPSSEFTAQSETTFSTANGYLGMRGGFQEGRPAFLHGTFVNGFYETWPIPYGEKAYGFAKTGQTMVNVPDGKIIRLYVDDEPFTVDRATMDNYERALDFKKGTYERELIWETPGGKRVKLRTVRLVSLTDRHVAALRFEVTVLNAKAPVVIVSEMVDHSAEHASAHHEHAGVSPPKMTEEEDPRLAKSFKHRVLVPDHAEMHDKRALMGFSTRSSGMTLGCGMDHLVEYDGEVVVSTIPPDGVAQVAFRYTAEPGKTFTLTKYLTYHTSGTERASELRARSGRTLDRVMAHGFDALLADQCRFMDDFWSRADIQIDGPAHPRVQQCLRWNLFQLLQATGRVENAGVPAKGLTGQAYEGHYFWDMEVYVMPFLIYSSPEVARNLLKFRHGMLGKARERARELNQKGALFPWRTISGDEASAYYAAGTAQYHINAAIAYALKKYVEVTGDKEFLCEYGAEILVETARLWYDLGFFSDRQGGKFCIHSVTGPDEYTAVVNNNAYTNLMARENLWYAAQAVEMLRKDFPQDYVALAHATKLEPGEAADWQRAADLMFVPFDERTGINPQDDDFLDREVWDIKNTPKDKFPLLLHYHPLVIYRYQVIKQADIVLAMFMLGNEFTREQKKRNFDYYDPLTTGDSSLSACIQSIVAAEIGYDDVAIKYLRFAVLMDLADVGGNVRDGVHIASIGGTWMAIVYGLAGMRDYDGVISFDPKKFVDKLKFPLTIRGQKLIVDIDHGNVTYTLAQGAGLAIMHRDEELKLTEGKGVTKQV